MFVTSIVLAVLAQAAPAAQAKTELAGVVVDAGGKPVAGALVLLSSLHRIGGKNPTLARTTTDAQGRFRHQAPSTNPTGENEIWTLWAYRPGASLGVAAVGSGKGLTRPGSPITLTLGPSRSVAVRVLDPTGRPVEGARVRPVLYQLKVTTSFLSGPAGPARDRQPARRADRRTGRGRARGPAARRVSISSASRPPGSATSSSLVAGAKDGPRTARLAPVGRLTGRVPGPNPGRARGVTIQVTTSLNGPERRTGFEPEGQAEVVIDDAGRFEVPALAVGKLRLTLQPSDGSPERELPAPDVAIEAGKTSEVAIALKGLDHLRTVAGRVVDRQGNPVAGAVVFQSGDGPSRTRTDHRRPGPLPARRRGRPAGVRLRTEARLPVPRSARRDGGRAGHADPDANRGEAGRGRCARGPRPCRTGRSSPWPAG